jgi:hypothetical protein
MIHTKMSKNLRPMLEAIRAPSPKRPGESRNSTKPRVTTGSTRWNSVAGRTGRSNRNEQMITQAASRLAQKRICDAASEGSEL